MSVTLILGILLVLILLRYHWNRRRFYIFSWKLKGPFAWPLVGSAFSFSGDSAAVTQTFQDLYKKYASSIIFWFGPLPAYIVQSPEEISIILNSTKCLKKDASYNIFRPIIGNGLIAAPVRIWKVHRKALNPTFNQKILDSYIRIFQEQSVVLVKKLEAYVGKEEFDIMTLINLYTLDVLCESAMGIKLHGQDRDSRFIYCFNRAKAIAFQRLYHIWLRSDFIFHKTALYREANGLVKEVRDFTRTVVQKKRAEVQNRKDHMYYNEKTDEFAVKRKSFLEHILELTGEENTFTDEDCIDEVATFMTAGSDTTATTNSFAAVALGMHPDIQQKVFEELDEVFGDSDRPVTIDDLPKLKYLERVIKEVMRIFPPLLIISRGTTDELDLKTVTVPQGISLLMIILNVHRDPKNFPDPLKFDPDRFLPAEIEKRHPYAYIPFSSGARNCIGFQFGLMSMKVTLVTILRTYKFKTSYKKIEDIQLGMHVTTRPVDGHMVQIEYRKKLIRR